MISSTYSIFNNRKTPTRFSFHVANVFRYGPHKLAKILHNAFCVDSISFTIFDSNAQPPPPQRTLSDLASPISGPPAQSPPTSEHLDFATTSTPRDTLSPATPLSPPKTPVAQPLTLPTNTITTQPTTTSTTEEKTEEKAEDKQGLRVLLVEDNEINLKLLIATMRKLKLEHATATNGLEAFNSYKEKHGKFDVVFMGTFPLPSASFPCTIPPTISIPPFSHCSCSGATDICTRYLHAHNVRHRIHTAHPPLRERTRPGTRCTYRAHRRSESEYEAGGVQFWGGFVLDEAGADEGAPGYVGGFEEGGQGGFCWIERRFNGVMGEEK
jgi:hypothetical protein